MSIFKKALSVIAPVLASVLPGPLGGMAQNVLTKALGINPEANEHEIESALAKADPAMLKALRDAEQQFILDMKQIDVDVLALDVKDRDSARSMHKEIRDWTPTLLGSAAVMGFGGLIYFLTQNPIPVANEKVLYLVIGGLGSIVTQVFNFYFGSSEGSAKKNDIIKNLKNGGK